MLNADAPRVSVIVPGADDEAALRATVESALAAPPFPLEMLVVAGGGVDAVEALAPLEDERLLVVPLDGISLGARVNVGIALARAPFVKLLLRPGTRLSGERLAREAALLAERPQCAALFSAGGPAPGAPAEVRDAAALVAGLLERRVPACETALVRTDALRAIGGVDATLGPALAYDLWLRLLRDRELALAPALLDREDDASFAEPPPESEASRAEHGFALVRAVHGDLDRWMRLVQRSDGCDEREAWLGLAARLARSGLAEAAPLARVARRRADAQPRVAAPHAGLAARVLSPAIDPAGAARDPAATGPSEPLADAQAVRDAAAAIQRVARVRRALGELDETLRRTSERLAYEVGAAESPAAETAQLVTRALDKLRLGHRAAELWRRALGRWRRDATRG